jgi:transposase-like protein
MTDTTTQTDPAALPSNKGPRIISEVTEKAARRRFSAEYKQRILSQADACTELGEIGQLLRREGLYSSHLSKWRAQRDRAVHEGLSRKRGRKPAHKNPSIEENARLQNQVKRLEARVAQAQTIIEVQKKLSQLLSLSESPVHEGNS